MKKIATKHLVLPAQLRSKLANPLGELITGTIQETSVIINERFNQRNHLLVGVGDVTSELLVKLQLKPDLVLTDGQTKRTKLEFWLEIPGYEVLEASCPAAEITKEVWQKIREAIGLINKGKLVHLKIHGEEDLLVLPLLIDLPKGSVVIYGQPNTGAVVRIVDDGAKKLALSIISLMTIKE